jgi:hypothetical protein
MEPVEVFDGEIITADQITCYACGRSLLGKNPTTIDGGFKVCSPACKNKAENSL